MATDSEQKVSFDKKIEAVLAKIETEVKQEISKLQAHVEAVYQVKADLDGKLRDAEAERQSAVVLRQEADKKLVIVSEKSDQVDGKLNEVTNTLKLHAETTAKIKEQQAAMDTALEQLAADRLILQTSVKENEEKTTLLAMQERELALLDRRLRMKDNDEKVKKELAKA